MGVKGLWTLVEPVARPVRLETLAGKRLAVDASIWLHQFLKAMRDKEGNLLRGAHVLGFFRRICKLLFHGIKPVFVFDGGTPTMKRLAIVQRRKRKAGTRNNLQRTAERLLAAQLKIHALRELAASSEERLSNGKSSPHKESNLGSGPASSALRSDAITEVPDDVTFVDDLEEAVRKGAPIITATASSARVGAEKTAKRKRDEYDLPDDNDEGPEGASSHDPRLVTEEELRSFIDSHKNDVDLSLINIDSYAFQQLPLEIQHEIILDQKNKSRQSSWQRLDSMIKAAPTAVDFSKLQIRNLVQRNHLTERLHHFARTGDAGMKKKYGGKYGDKAMRVASERNREYVLVKNDETLGGGYTMKANVVSRKIVEKGIVVGGGGFSIKSGEVIDMDAEAKDGSSDLESEAKRTTRGMNGETSYVVDSDDDDDEFEKVDIDNYSTRMLGAMERDDVTTAPPSSPKGVSEFIGTSDYVDDDESVEAIMARFEMLENGTGEFETVGNGILEERFQDESIIGSAAAGSLSRYSISLGPCTPPDFDVPVDFSPDDLMHNWLSLSPVEFQQEYADHRSMMRRAIFDWDDDELDVQASTAQRREEKSGAGSARAVAAGFWKKFLVAVREWKARRIGDGESASGITSSAGDSEGEKVLRSGASSSAASVAGDDRFGVRGPQPLFADDSEDEDSGGEISLSLLPTHTATAKVLESSPAPRILEDGSKSAREVPSQSVVPQIPEPVIRTSPTKYTDVKELLRFESDDEDTDFAARLTRPDVGKDGKEEVKGAMVQADGGHRDREQRTESNKEKIILSEQTAAQNMSPVSPEDHPHTAVPPESLKTFHAPKVLNPEDRPNPILSPEPPTTVRAPESPRPEAPPQMASPAAVPTEGGEDLDRGAAGEALQRQLNKMYAQQDSEDTLDASYTVTESVHSEEDNEVEMIVLNDDENLPPSPPLPSSEPPTIPPHFKEPQPDEDVTFPTFGEDDDVEAQVDVPVALNEENDEFARFVSELSNKDVETVSQSLHEEMISLNRQKAKEQRDASDITTSMVNETQELLRLFGLPYIIAPMEAESQCAYLIRHSLVDGIVTDDSDVFLFGGTVVYKNMFNQSRYVERYDLSELEEKLKLGRERLVALAYLLGSDYTEGVAGVGPVSAVEILDEWGGEEGEDLEALKEFREWWVGVANGEVSRGESSARKKLRKICKKLEIPVTFPDPRVVEAYINPQIDEDTTNFVWGTPDTDGLREYMEDKLGWDEKRVDEVLVPVVREMARKQREGVQQQSTLDRFFAVETGGVSHKSGRIEQVVQRWGGKLG
ncbi:DNA repair protein rad2, partial [Borealophlyctis nickersoniae]